MNIKKISGKKAAVANQYDKERDFWLNNLSGELARTGFAYDLKKSSDKTVGEEKRMDSFKYRFPRGILKKISKLSNEVDHTLHVILITGLFVLLNKYTQNKDIIVGTPIFKQNIEGDYLNTFLVIRSQLNQDMTFKDLLLQVKQSVLEAVKNQNYPIELLMDQLNITACGNGDFPLIEVVLLLKNIHKEEYICHLNPSIIFSFLRTDEYIEAELKYNTSLYKETTIEKINSHYLQLLKNVLNDVDLRIGNIEIILEEEKQDLLYVFNRPKVCYEKDRTIHEFFEKQVEKGSDKTALIGGESQTDHIQGNQFLTYKELNIRSNQLARLLRKNGAGCESVVGILMDHSMDTVVSLLGILKSGGAYLPIKPGTPPERVQFMLKDAGARILLSNSQCVKPIPFSYLQNPDYNTDFEILVTPGRDYIKEFDKLPLPDRSLINFKNYKGKIGMASVIDCISLQTTRGCPYECLYCHKIWSKKHVQRSAENIFNEIEYYYKNGVRNFAVIDDCFNLDKKKSSNLFKLIIKNKLDLRLFFPNGLRGDIMTTEYVDLMVEAGTRGINLSLETASPRLQKLLRKNLDLSKFKRVVDYIASQHPNVILEMATMHGFPTETEEEAMQTLNFIKSIKWLHFPYIHILKIFPNTEMEAFALDHGASKKDILSSKDLAFHELPDTLPFPKSFTREYQANFLNEYFLLPVRLEHVLPYQIKVLSDTALTQKYNAYLPTEIKNINDIIKFAQLEGFDVPEGYGQEEKNSETIFDRSVKIAEVKSGAKKILFLDLSQHFSSYQMLYRVVEQPLGGIYLLTYLKERFVDKIDCRIYKSGNDFDTFEELKVLIEDYSPDLVGIRTLTFFKDFFHETVSLLRQWGLKAPIITGGPYASSDYISILRDKNVDLVVLGEGEYSFAELIEQMLKNDFKIPEPSVLKKIKGIAYKIDFQQEDKSLQALLIDRLADKIANEVRVNNLGALSKGNHLMYVMYTSGSTGRPKGVMVDHRQVNNCISWMQDKFKLDSRSVILNRTNLTFDPSVWEIFWALSIGGSVKVIGEYQSKDAEYLINLMAKDAWLTMMYCPATLVAAMTYILNTKSVKPNLELPWLIIGAEPIQREVVKNFYSYYRGKIVNTYGPTECTINNTYYDLNREDIRSVVPIGSPIANNQIYILSEHIRLMPLNVPGEICIAGDSVSRGYINDPGKTSECFIDHFLGEGQLYKTGDIGRWLDDRNLEIMGRKDDQIKIRGYRIDPGEIKSNLLRHKYINDCIVVVRNNKEQHENIKICKECGINSKYPDVKINEAGICEICLNFEKYRSSLFAYFKSLSDLEQIIREINKDKRGKYDCLLLYGGGRGSAYALYRLVDLGFKILAVTYDNGYYGKADINNISKITSSLGVDHIVLKHKNSEKILKESLKTAHTVCRGCFHTSFSLAGKYAYRNNIKIVIGATLSRGQIIENKLFMFLKQGKTKIKELENEILNFQMMAPKIDKDIFELIDIDEITDSSVYNKVKFIDFYRYCDITNEEMISYLDNRDLFWKSRKSYAVYSTNCPIKQLGDYSYLQQHGYHYYGAATSWEKRIGHLTMENLEEDLKCTVTPKGFENFSKKVGFKREITIDESQKSICAYFVSSRKFQISELREYLMKELPEYMIPTHFMQVDCIPLDANGKIDRRSLPEPELDAAKGDFVAPRDEFENTLVRLWSEVLNIDKKNIGIDDRFFDLGGNSLRASMIVSRLNKEFNIKIQLAEIFLFPTIRKLSANMSEAPVKKFFSIPVAEKKEYYPLSSAQKRLYIIQSMDEKSTVFNMSSLRVIEGYCDRQKFEAAIKRMIERHESLRTSFELVADEPVQKIHDEVNFEVLYYKNDAGKLKSIARDLVRPFDLRAAPQLRVGLIETGDFKNILILDIHHIIFDGSSMALFEKEFPVVYNGEELPGLKLQYKDYSEWQNSQGEKESLKKQESFWLKEFDGKIPVLALPSNFPETTDEPFGGCKESFALDIEETEALRSLAREENVTMYMVLLAIYNVFLSKIYLQEDIVVGTPVEGRKHADLEPVIGMFVNMLALRNYPRAEKIFKDFLNEVKERTLKAFDNKDYPFENLVERVRRDSEYSSNPLFNVTFTFYNRMEQFGEEVPPVESTPVLEQLLDENRPSKYELDLIGEEKKDDLSFRFHYRRSLFKKDAVIAFVKYFKKIVSVVVDNPQQRIMEINIFSEKQKDKIRSEVRKARHAVQADFDI